MIRNRLILAVAGLTTLAFASAAYVTAQAGDPPKGPPSTRPAEPPKLADIAWIAGAWKGEAFGGKVEEHWIAPAGGCMTGMFRLIGGDGKMRVCEFMMIEQEKERVVYRFRHYNPGLRPWEPDDKPLTFNLVRATREEAVFENPGQQDPKRLVYRRDGKTGLVVRVEKEKDGKVVERFDVVMKRP